MAAALRLPEGYISDHLSSMGAVLVPGMVGMWLVSGALATVFLGVSIGTAMLIGAIVTPTDPVLAGTIVTRNLAEESIPARVRHVLTGEAGANDGLAYLFVFLPMLLLQYSPDRAISQWLLETVLWEVGSAVVVGVLVGACAGFAEHKSVEYEVIEETSLLTLSVAFTFAVLGGVKLLGSDGILAAFVAGLFFTRFAESSDKAEEQKIQETVLRLFTFPVFVIFGLALPWEQWITLGWEGLALVVGVLLFRRVPVALVFQSLVSPMVRPSDALFAGWFGPIGSRRCTTRLLQTAFLGTPSSGESSVSSYWALSLSTV